MTELPRRYPKLPVVILGLVVAPGLILAGIARGSSVLSGVGGLQILLVMLPFDRAPAPADLSDQKVQAMSEGLDLSRIARMSGASPPRPGSTDTVVGGGKHFPRMPGRRLPVRSHQMAEPMTKGLISSAI
jgi:hypothetical protein